MVSEDVKDPIVPAEAGGAAAVDGSRVRTYLYLRLAIIGLLGSLGVAVGYQALRQGGVLASVSAYYYTPAQTIFVGALIGFGACMIALKGTNAVENVFLNLAGMFAVAVAVVPTSRSADYDTALQACQRTAAAAAGSPASGLNCPAVQALAAATRADVANNMFALVVVGAAGVFAAWWFTLRRRTGHPGFWWGPAAASLVWLAGVIGLLFLGWLVDHGHIVAALGLTVSIVGVAGANAVRHTRDTQGGMTSPTDRYAIIGGLMLLVTAVDIVLYLIGVLSVFWVEIVVAALFIVLWITQTMELGDLA